MIEEPGIVMNVDADAVWVATQRKTTCGSCAARVTCGQGILTALSADKKPQMIKVRSNLPLHKGDQVTLGIAEETLVRSAFLVYMLPLFFMFAAALSAQALSMSEPWIIFSAVVGFLAGTLWVRHYSERYTDAAAMQPVVLKAQPALNPTLKACN